jgi:hypothetical protein
MTVWALEMAAAAFCFAAAGGLVLGWLSSVGTEDDARLELDIELRRHLNDLNDANTKLREINNALREARERP